MTEKSTIDLADQISGANEGDTPIEASLQTDEKVIARITDGIYRQPSSALRELISNSYDADATNVQIETDFPRYSEITIRDNGHGMGPKALANLIEHIGGSAKRNAHGIDLGVTNESNPNLTKLGRKLIGKIGIGLFSVAQLTQQFKIITKRKGDDYRLIAEVTLNTFSEEYLSNTQKKDGETTFESGKVRITKVKALDIEAHGTDIVLFNLRKNALSILKSEEMWSRVDDAEKPNQKKEYQPSYHIGRFTKNEKGELIETINMALPWDNSILPTERFVRIYKSLLDEVEHSRSTPRLDNTFDNYFQTIWNLALSSPIEYIYKHPFELNNEDNIIYYELANDKSVKPKKITFNKNETYHQIKNTSIPEDDPVGGFEVFIDGIKLYRPIAFTEQKKSENALQTPLMFYGSYFPNLIKFDNKLSGGPLRFEAYFFWNSKILPLDHNGVMIRINGASGTLYDPRWLGYPVAEKTTLGQITAEIYVLDGMDSALNIDRESFNYSHPHYQILSQWLHNALRQITAEQKKLRAERVKENKQKITTKQIEGLLKTASAQLINNSSISLIEFENDEKNVLAKREKGFTSFIYPECMNPADTLQVEKIKLLFGILQAKGLLENLSYYEQNELIESFAEVLFFKDN